MDEVAPAPVAQSNVGSVGARYSPENPYPQAGQPVPGQRGFVYNWAGGMEPGGAGNPVPGMPGYTYGADGYSVVAPASSPSAATTAPANANYDGYAAPGFVPTAKGDAPAGWDATKWADANHQTPKYVIGKILSNYADTPAGLQAAMADIQRAYPGATMANAQSGKITLPGVGTIDVGLSFGSGGGRGWAWNPVDDTAGSPVGTSTNSGAPNSLATVGSAFTPGANSSMAGINAIPSQYPTGIGNLDGWGMQFDPGTGGAPTYQPLSPWSLTDLSAATPFTYDPLKTIGSFEGPTAETFKTDPGYEFRLNEGVRAYENSNAAKGALHTPNVLRGINDYAQNFASNEYGNVWNRDFNTWNANNQTEMAAQAQRFGQGLNAAQFNEGARQGVYGINNNNAIARRADELSQNSNVQNSIWNAYNTNYANARDRYLMAYDTFRNNQNDNFNRNYQVASLGAGAA